MTSCTRNLARAWGVCGRMESPKPSVAGAALGSNERSGRFLSHAPFQAQEISSSLFNAFLKFASLIVYVRLQHRSQTEISLRFIYLFIEK